MPKSVLRAFFGRMQFTLHATRRAPHDASRLVQAMSAWLVKTRRAPARHSRDARIYGHTTTAMHKLSTPTPPGSLDFSPCRTASTGHGLAWACDALHKQCAGQSQRASPGIGEEVDVAVRAAGARLGTHSGIYWVQGYA